MENQGSLASLVGLLHFEDPALLRGVRLTDVLRNCGRLFTSSTGTAETYALSSRVDHIDVFVSHNWAVGRLRKFAILLFYFNVDIASASMVATNMIVLPLIYVASLREEAFLSEEATTRTPADLGYVPVAATCNILTFVAALFCGHRAKEVLRLHGERLFLDKVCISQVDEEAKARGIRNLGAFLRSSSNLLVCFTGLYLKKIWTMYEFASFLLLHQGKIQGVHVIPSGLPLVVTFATVSGWAGAVLARVLGTVSTAAGLPFNAGNGIPAAILDVLGIFVSAFLYRAWAGQYIAARAAFKGFRFEDAVCAVESDRDLVRRNILQLMRHSTLDLAATDEEALHAFDEFVRTAGLHAFDASVGRLGFPYRFMLPFCLVSFSDNAGYLCFRPHRQHPAWNLALEFNSELVGAFAAVPLVAAVCLRLTKCCSRLRGVCEVAYCGAVAVLTLVTLALAHPDSPVVTPLRLAAYSSPFSLAGVGYFVHCLFVCGAAALAFRPRRSAYLTPAHIQAYLTRALQKEGCSQPLEEPAGVEDAPPELEYFN